MYKGDYMIAAMKFALFISVPYTNLNAFSRKYAISDIGKLIF